MTRHPLTLADSGKVQVGDSVLAIGTPFGLADTITDGIVSATGRTLPAPNGYPIAGAIQTDAPINPGNSGGVLLDTNGDVIGVTEQIETAGTSRSSAGVGFAVPSSTVQQIVPDLIKNGHVTRGYLGVSTVAVTPQVAQQFHLGVDHGALVVQVADGSPAARAGIRGGNGGPQALTGGGDVITAVDGQQITGPADLAQAVAEHKPGDAAQITIVRDGRQMQVKATLGQRSPSS